MPKDISELMQQGICPVCKIPMIKQSGKRTHSRSKAIVCEEKLREMLRSRGYETPRSTMTTPDGKTVEVDVKTISLEEAKRMKDEK